MITFEPPRLPDESRELYRFLYDLTEKLNLMAEQTSAEAMWTTTLKALNSPLTGETLASSEGATSNDQLGAIRQLIIGSADVMFKVADTESLSLSGLYVAKSEFGTYFENATVTINGTPWGIEQLYNYSADIDSIYGAYKQDTEAYIKTGLLYYNGVTPVYGVGVGELYNSTAEYGETEDVTFDPSKTYYEKLIDDSFAEYTGSRTGDPSSLHLYEATIIRDPGYTGHYATFTANDMKFWQGGTELASISASGLNFPNAYIIGGDIKIGTPSNGEYPFHVATNGNLTIGFYDNTLDGDYPFIVDNTGALKATGATITGTLKAQTGSQIGNFKFSDAAIHSEYMTGLNTGYGVWVGTDGVGVQNSAGTAYAYLQASDGTLHASGATISGAITATSLDITSATITGTLSASKISGGTLNFNNISASGTLSAAYIKLFGKMGVFATAAATSASGYLGWFPGYDGETGTNGIGMYVSSGGAIKATASGASMAYTGSTTYGEIYVTSGAALKAARSGTSKTVSMQYDSSQFAFEPAMTDDSNTIALGGASRLWKQLYAGTATINTSDRNKKHSISYDIDDYEAVFDDLKPAKFKFNDGESNRYHTGFIAQDIEDTLDKLGMSTLDLAAFIKSPCYSDEGEFEGYAYGLRYEEMVALNTLKIKKLEERIRALEGAN